jgi:hypothetical protein
MSAFVHFNYSKLHTFYILTYTFKGFYPQRHKVCILFLIYIQQTKDIIVFIQIV